MLKFTWKDVLAEVAFYGLPHKRHRVLCLFGIETRLQLFLQTLHVNKFHAACTLAGTDEGVVQVLRFFQTNAAGYCRKVFVFLVFQVVFRHFHAICRHSFSASAGVLRREGLFIYFFYFFLSNFNLTFLFNN